MCRLNILKPKRSVSFFADHLVCATDRPVLQGCQTREGGITRRFCDLLSVGIVVRMFRGRDTAERIFSILRKRSIRFFLLPLFVPLLVLLPTVIAATAGAGDGRTHAEEGVLDLRGVYPLPKNRANRVLDLAGPWEFLYGEHRDPVASEREKPWPQAAHLAVPSTWKGFPVDGQPLPGTGIATFRLRILLDEHTPERLALLIPAWETAYELYVNGRMVARAGTVGSDRHGTVPRWKPMVVVFSTEGETVEIVAHLANFHHARGGPAMMPRIGTIEAIRGVRERGVALRLFTFGSLSMIALYHGAIFLLRRKERGTLYFSLFALLMAVRSLVVDEQAILLLFSELPWGLHVRITYLTFALAVPAFFFFIVSLYEPETVRAANLTVDGIAFGYALMIFFGPAKAFTALLPAFQLFLVTSGVYCLFVLIRAVRRQRPGSLLFLTASLVFLGFVVNDILYNQMIITTAYIVPVGVLVFVFLQAIILARHYSLAFVRVEELFREKTKLEGKALTLRNLTLLDALTGIANRRRFDQYLLQEWRRAARKQSCLACIMMDIDFFKRFNDTQGHPTGDEALRKIAGALGRAVRRPADLVVRYGGEEFAALLPDTDLTGARSLAEQIRNTVLELAIPRADAVGVSGADGTPEVVTISLGCAATIPEVAETEPVVLVRRADAALYRAKELGRNRTEVEPV